jgi:chemotaxis protein methyltransferase CheR
MSKKTTPGEQIEDLGTSSRFALSNEEFLLFRDLIHRVTGISLSEHKRELIVSRLTKRLRVLGLSSFSEYYDFLTEDPRGQEEMGQLVNRITTNKTDFYREAHHFQYLSDFVLPDLVAEKEARGDHRIRAWSAACSTGEEPYTLAITLSEFFENRRGWEIKILASDLDTEVLNYALKGIYPAQRLAPVPSTILHKYFQKAPGLGQAFQVKDQLRRMLTFNRVNLQKSSFPFKEPLDFIFCRNVMIYFDMAGKISLLQKFHRVLRPGGHIFVGHSESLMMVKDLFKYCQSTIYRKI